MESDIYHDLGHRRKQLLKANKTELLHCDLVVIVRRQFTNDNEQ